MYHPESQRIYTQLISELPNLKGGTVFQLNDICLDVAGKDGLGGLIEEWLGVWAAKKGINIHNPKLDGGSQEFPDYYVGDDKGLLEIKSFDSNASANFDIANFESYCESLAKNPGRLNSDYLIFSYSLSNTRLKIENIWLKKIWEISCPSTAWPLKVQQKRNVIYNIRPATWYSNKTQFRTFRKSEEFVQALYLTQKKYRGFSQLDEYLSNKSKVNV